MAFYTVQETKMFAKWYGNKDLANEAEFWQDCFTQYLDKAVILPLVDNAQNRFRLHRLMVCPKGMCGRCCSCYGTVPLSQYDVDKLAEVSDGRIVDFSCSENNQISLVTEGGCKFLENNSCSIYNNRPFVCSEFPIQTPYISTMADGTKFEQITYRLACLPALLVIQKIFQEATQDGKAVLMPDLTLIPEYKEVNNENDVVD